MDADPRRYEKIEVNEKDIHSIVVSYLVHNCYKDTLESFAACTGMKQPVDHLDDMEKRKSKGAAPPRTPHIPTAIAMPQKKVREKVFICKKVELPLIKGITWLTKIRDDVIGGRVGLGYLNRILHFASDGNASKAIELTEEFAPGLLDENKDLHFDLLSLHFIELVCSRKIEEALGFAQINFTPLGKEQKYVAKLEDLMALLAYDEPEKSPMFHLLSSEHRQNVADSLNRAILERIKLPRYSAVERLIQQTTVVTQCLSQDFGKDGQKPFSLKDFLNS